MDVTITSWAGKPREWALAVIVRGAENSLGHKKLKLHKPTSRGEFIFKNVHLIVKTLNSPLADDVVRSFLRRVHDPP